MKKNKIENYNNNCDRYMKLISLSGFKNLF